MATPNLNLEATIVANGQVFPGWEAIEITREFNAIFSTMKFRAAENTDGGNIPAGALSLDVGDRADGYLCGQKVISGFVLTRQVVADKGTHGVEIMVAAHPQSLDAGTVQGKPRQYLNQTVAQIAQSAAGLAGVKVRLIGELNGTEIPFPRISEHIGERLADFIGRLARWRNLTDDENDNLCLVRGDSGGQSVAQLQEGRNVESFRMLKTIQYAVDPVIFNASQPGSDVTNGTDASQVAITKTNPNYNGPPRSMVILGDSVGGKQELEMAVTHAMSNMNLWAFEVVATVPGWQMDNGQLWILACFPKVTPISIYSPMLQPKAPLISDLSVRGVRHIQDNERGTVTEVTCALAASFGGDAIVRSSSDASFGGDGSTIFGNEPTIPATNAPGGPGTAR